MISIIVPVHQPPPYALEAAIESVRTQTYANWQLCLADGASDDPRIAAILDEHAAADNRIHVTHLPANLGISGNSNAALATADGEFVALLDHDDTLAPNALYESVALLNREPDADIVYFDEDKLSADGKTRDHPWFKPDFSPDLMLSTNLLMHCVYRRSLVEEAGGFDPSTDGAQDWDLALRCSRRTNAIHHIPKVLYHWRQVPGSTSADATAKPWAFDAQAAALRNHLNETDGVTVQVDFPTVGRTHVIWPPMDRRVSIIIPTRDKLNLLRPCLDSIFAHTTYPEYEIMLVDTGSVEQETLAYYDDLQAQHANLTVANLPGRFNFSAACNTGARAASGELLLFLNNDTEALKAGWLHELAGWASRPGVGVVGAKLLRSSGVIQHAGIIIGLAGHGSHIFEDVPEDTYGIFGSTEWYRTYQAVTGACMMVPRPVFEEMGGFDEVYQIGYSDLEFCLRASQAGYRTVFTPFARLLHKEGSSRGFYVPSNDVLRGTCQVLPAIRRGDRYFNPNLSIRYRKPVLRRPEEPESTAAVIEIMRDYHLLPSYVPGKTPDMREVDLPVPAPWPLSARTSSATSLRDLSVLIASHDLSSSGAPRFAALLARELAAAGTRVTVISPEDGPVRADLETAGIDVLIAPSMSDFDGTSLLTRLDISALSRAVDAHDLVIANSIVTALAVNAATAFDKPSIYWLHESRFGYEVAKQSANVRSALLDANRVVLLTPYLANLYGDFLSDDNSVIVPIGLDEQNLVASTDNSMSVAADKITVVSAGSLEPRKGQDFLLASILDLPESIRNKFEVYFLGRTVDKKYAERLREQARTIPNVHFEGDVGHDQVMDRLATADIFVLSSQDEVLPLSVLEAMYHGLAIVATRAGGVPDVIVDGENGLLIDFGDRRALAQALRRLSEDADLRVRLGENAAATFHESYTIGAFRPRFLDLVALTAHVAVEPRTVISSP